MNIAILDDSKEDLRQVKSSFLLIMNPRIHPQTSICIPAQKLFLLNTYPDFTT